MFLYFTGINRISSSINDDQVRLVQSADRDSIDSTLRLKEQAYRMNEAILRRDLPSFAQALACGWENKRKLAQSVSNSHIDEIDQTAISLGAAAGKVSGGSGGGIIMYSCDGDQKPCIRDGLSKLGGEWAGFPSQPRRDGIIVVFCKRESPVGGA